MRKFVFSLIFSLLTIVGVWADTTFRASAPNAVVVGQQFRVEYVLNARGSSCQADLEGKGFEVLYGPSASSYSSTSNINGQVSSEVRTTFSYVLLAEKEGTFTLPAATCKCEGNTLTSNTVTIKVLPADEKVQQGGGEAQGSNDRGRRQQAGDGKFNKDDYHLILDLSKTSAYEGEAIVATLKLYWRNTQMGNPSDVKLPDFEGFTVQEMDNSSAQTTLEHFQGSNYSMYPLARWLLFPSHSGELTIPAASLKANVQVVTTRRSGGFFDWPMEYTQNVEVPLQSAVRKVNVKSLPSGRPASYMNAVGDFQIHSELTANQVKTNDAVIYRITIDGVGNLKYVKEPEPDFPSDFEVFDPKVDLNTAATSAGVKGKKIIEYTIIPRHSGSFQIPAISFGYFDVKSGEYKVIQTQSHSLEVEKGANDESQSGSVDFSGTNQERLKVLGNDIRYLHGVDAGSLDKDQEPFFGGIAYWLFFVLPFLAFIVISVIYRRNLRLNADVVGKRTRKAGKVAERRLKDAAAALKQKNENNFYESIHKAILGYVSDKLRIQYGELSIDNIQQTLQEHKVGEETVRTVKEVLETCQFARYAPSHDDHAMDELYRKTSDLIDQLESEIKK